MHMIRLRSLLASRLAGWSLAWLLGALTLWAAIGLLAVSGWFISAAALAGLATVAAYGFDYFRPAAIIRFFAIVRTAGRYAERLASHNAALGLLSDLRQRVFARLASLPDERLRLTRSARLMHRLVADIDLLDQFPLRVILPWCWASLLLALVLGFHALLVPELFWAVLPGLLLAWLLPWVGLWYGGRLARLDVELGEQRREQLLDSLRLMTPLLLWQRWQARQQDFVEQDQRCLHGQNNMQRLTSVLALLQQGALALAIGMLLWQAPALLAAEALNVPWLLAALLAVLGLNEAMLPLAGSFVSLGLSQAARDRLNAVAVAADEPAVAAPGVRPASPWSLQLEDVSTRQPGALYGPQAVSLALHSGQVLHLRGPSGSGKSTLLQLLAGEPLAFSGQRWLNGRDYADWDWRGCIGYLPQQVDIFDLSLAVNLRLGNPQASDEQLWQVLEDVGLRDWAAATGLDAPLGELGNRVSGGQARRIALARLLLAERPILLLDEPFAGLDAATRSQVLAALCRRQASGLLLIVSHQPLAISGVVVLDLSPGVDERSQATLE